MQWFKHDIGAFRDGKVQQLRLECGGAAVDAYYAILELIYEREAPVEIGEHIAETKSVSYWLCLGFSELETYVKKMGEIGLLDVTEKTDSVSYVVKSKRAMEAIALCKARSETARQNGKKGGRPKGSKTKRKANETQSVFPENQTESKKNQNKTKTIENRLVGKTNQPTYSGAGVGAADEDPPTPRRAVCPLCGTPMGTTGMPDPDWWWCPHCKDSFPKAKAHWEEVPDEAA